MVVVEWGCCSFVDTASDDVQNRGYCGGGRWRGGTLSNMTRPSSDTADPSPGDAFAEVFERVPDPILVADDDGRYVFANAAARELLRVTPEQAVRLSLADVAADSGGANAAWQSFLRDGHQEGEFVLRRGDGSLVPVEFNAIANVTPSRHLSVVRDVSDRKRIEDLLRHNEERFVKAFIASPAPTTIQMLETGAFIEVNEAFSNVLGFWRSDIIGRTASSIGLWPDESVLESLLTGLRSGTPEVGARANLRTKDRTARDFAVAMRRVDMHEEPHVIAVYWLLASI